MGASPDSPVDATSFLDRTFNLRKRWASMGINPGLGRFLSRMARRGGVGRQPGKDPVTDPVPGAEMRGSRSGRPEGSLGRSGSRGSREDLFDNAEPVGRQ